MFQNCYTYNEPGVDVVVMAKKLESKARMMMKGMPHPEVAVTAQRHPQHHRVVLFRHPNVKSKSAPSINTLLFEVKH